MMRQERTMMAIRAEGPGLVDFTEKVRDFVRRCGITEGILTLFCRHTSASLLIQENASPAARRDLERYFERIAPESRSYEHEDEGPDDMPAHLRAALTQTHLSIPIADGHPQLGTWQGIFLFEHRRGLQHREVVLHLIGE